MNKKMFQIYPGITCRSESNKLQHSYAIELYMSNSLKLKKKNCNRQLDVASFGNKNYSKDIIITNNHVYATLCVQSVLCST